MEVFFIFKIILLAICVLLLLLLAFLMIELIKVLMGVRRMIARLELITDVAGWFKLIRKFSRRKKEK
jgi:hypothetical protein